MRENLLIQNGWSPLIRVGASGNLDAVKTLIGAGAKVNQMDEVSYECSLKDSLRMVVELELDDKKEIKSSLL